ncbi:MAG: hypothetical protein JW818_09745 [Pirellulales bacterium]|nr:hypothetical protein [Pirellulales bacterium]
MSIWNKVLVGLIIVASGAFLWLAIDVLGTQEYWRSRAKDYEKKIAPLPAEIEKDQYGDFQKGCEGGVFYLQTEINKLTLGRGRVWYGCTPGRLVDAAKGNLTVNVPQVIGDEPGGGAAASPPPIAVSTVVYIFEQSPQEGPGHFLGEYRVTQVGQGQVVLEATLTMTPELQKYLKNSVAAKQTWTLCEQLPKDSHEIFAGKTRDDLAKILPASVVDEYAKDGKKGFERQLRDYHFLLKSYDRQWAVLAEEKQRSTRELKELQSTVEVAKRQLQTLQDIQVVLEGERAEARRQFKLVQDHLKTVEAMKAEREAEVKRLAAENQTMADQIAKMWEAAAQYIQQKTAIAGQ